MSDSDYPKNEGQTDEEIAAEIAASNGEEFEGSPPPFPGQGGFGSNEAAQEEIASLKEKTLRLAAELENTRRRAERDKVDGAKYAIANFARDLLSVADNFERALTAVPEDKSDVSPESFSALVTGVRMTDNELRTVFQRHGIKQISPKGEKFDPNLHQAVAQAPSAVPVGHVADVAQSGFTIGERVLRAAMVVVSTGGGDDTKNPDAGSGIRVDTQA